eukprot:6357426-Pyramimonas_sp.AAC.1
MDFEGFFKLSDEPELSKGSSCARRCRLLPRASSSPRWRGLRASKQITPSTFSAFVGSGQNHRWRSPSASTRHAMWRPRRLRSCRSCEA